MPRAASKSRKSKSQGTSSGGDAPCPDVIVDFHCADGILFISLKNIGERSAYGVGTKFDQPLVGLSGQKVISEMQLFRCVEFVPPGKEFSQVVDPVAIWFQQERAMRYTVTIDYRDREGNKFQERITHDLGIYKDLGYISLSGGKDGKHAG